MRQQTFELNGIDFAGIASAGDVEGTSASAYAWATGPAAPAASTSRPLLWGLAGFLVGAMFWHLIGFWSFVAEVVLKGPVIGQAPIAASDPIEMRLRALATKAAGIRILSNPASCVALALDRQSGQTRRTACDDIQQPALAGHRTLRRGHRAALQQANDSASPPQPARPPSSADVAAVN